MRGEEKPKPKPLLYAISLQPSLLLLSMVKTFSFLRLLLRTNRSLLFHTITFERTWSFWLRFWDSCLWDNCSIYPEYFFSPHFLRALSHASSASTPAICLSISPEPWLAKKGRKEGNYILFSHNYKISSTYIKRCSRIFQIFKYDGV